MWLFEGTRTKDTSKPITLCGHSLIPVLLFLQVLQMGSGGPKCRKTVVYWEILGSKIYPVGKKEVKRSLFGTKEGNEEVWILIITEK